MKLSENLVVSRHVYDKRAWWQLNPSDPSMILKIDRCPGTYEEMIIQDLEIALELTAGAISDFGTPRSPTIPAAFARWFGEYSPRRRDVVRSHLVGLRKSLYLGGVSMLCGGCDERLHHPIELCKHTLQL